jgi:hypothetical protein
MAEATKASALKLLIENDRIDGSLHAETGVVSGGRVLPTPGRCAH